MKIQNLDETHFIRNDKFKDHYDNHVAKDYYQYLTDTSEESLEPMSMDDYDNNGDILSKAKVDTSDFDKASRYVGFVMQDGRILKCDKLLNEIVIYICKSPKNQATITYYQVTSYKLKNRYERLKAKHYHRDIIPNDDKYNI